MLDAINMPLARGILRELSSRGPLLRTELAAALDVSPSSLRLHLENLEHAGIVVGDLAPGQRTGRRVRYEVRPEGVVEAVDTLLAYMLTTNEYRIIRDVDRDV